MATWFPGATRDVKGSDAGPFSGGPLKIVVHTTEGDGWPSYQGGATAPHFTCHWDGSRFIIRQHVRLDRASKSLANERGGVETNQDGAIQIELRGTCDPTYRNGGKGTFWPDAPAKAKAALAGFLKALASLVGVPLKTVAFQAYPASYGRRGRTNNVRMSLSQWDNFSGICGHQHVPENYHGDPGDLDVADLLDGEATPVKVQPVRPPKTSGKKAPAFPLPRGHYFGPKTGPNYSHSGYRSSADRAGLRAWQAQMRTGRAVGGAKIAWSIAVDGLYGPQTAKVVRQFQAEKGLEVDGLIGPETWAAAWTAPVT